MNKGILISSKEIRKAVIAVRSELRLGLEHLEAEHLVGAYGAFERAERYAFQAKDLVRNGGKFETEKAEDV